MKIKARAIIDYRPIDGLEQFAKSFDDIMQGIVKDVIDREKPKLLDELRWYPAKRPNQRYERTFNLRRGWTVEDKQTANQSQLIVKNPVPYAVYVGGRIDFRSKSAARDKQAWMHKDRWVPWIDTIDFFYQDIREQVQTEFDNRISDEFGQFTVRRRNR